jgi:hypothetical protein
MWMAVFADMGASLLVVGNGLRLRLGNLTINPPRFTSELKHLPVYF